MKQNTTPDAERFQLDVDSLEAALLFDDYPAARGKLVADRGEDYARRVYLALAARLLLKGRAA